MRFYEFSPVHLNFNRMKGKIAGDLAGDYAAQGAYAIGSGVAAAGGAALNAVGLDSAGKVATDLSNTLDRKSQANSQAVINRKSELDSQIKQAQIRVDNAKRALSTEQSELSKSPQPGQYTDDLNTVLTGRIQSKQLRVKAATDEVTAAQNELTNLTNEKAKLP